MQWLTLIRKSEKNKTEPALYGQRFEEAGVEQNHEALERPPNDELQLLVYYTRL